MSGPVAYELDGMTVVYDGEGWPRFGPYLYPDGYNTLRIALTGSRARDVAEAWRATGLDRKTLSRQWTWHHHEELGVMQLIDRRVHRSFSHTGGLQIYRVALGSGSL